MDDDGTTVFDIQAPEYAEAVAGMIADGVSVVGGCCGTTPAHMAALRTLIDNHTPSPRRRTPSMSVTSAQTVVDLPSGGHKIAVICERINPTGKKRLQQALRDGDLDYVVRQGISQQEQGADILDVTVGNFSNLEILWGDVLKQDIPALVKEKFGTLRPMACANLPYYITSPILTALLEAECFQSVTVMVQKEVAQRIAAKPGTPDYSAFTVFCQYYAEPELLFDVPAHCFLPQPKVTSAVITMRTRQKRTRDIADEAVLFSDVRACFAMRRKKLSNGLSSGFPELGKAGSEAVIAAAGFDANVRGETLGIPEFARIANEIVRRKEKMRP